MLDLVGMTEKTQLQRTSEMCEHRQAGWQPSPSTIRHNLPACATPAHPLVLFYPEALTGQHQDVWVVQKKLLDRRWRMRRKQYSMKQQPRSRPTSQPGLTLHMCRQKKHTNKHTHAGHQAPPRFCTDAGAIGYLLLGHTLIMHTHSQDRQATLETKQDTLVPQHMHTQTTVTRTAHAVCHSSQVRADAPT